MTELTKQEAAKHIGISVRALERYTQQGRIKVKYVRGNRGAKTAHYEVSDLEMLKQELETPIVKPVVDSKISPMGELQNNYQIIERFAAVLAEALNERETSVSATISLGEKLILTLREAQAITNLSRRVLRDAIKAGKLRAQIIGRGYKIKRSDLEEFVASL